MAREGDMRDMVESFVNASGLYGYVGRSGLYGRLLA